MMSLLVVLNDFIINIMTTKLRECKINKMIAQTYHVDTSFDHKVMSSIIILKIEVSPRQPCTWELQFSNPEKGPKSEENDTLHGLAGQGPECPYQNVSDKLHILAKKTKQSHSKDPKIKNTLIPETFYFTDILQN